MTQYIFESKESTYVWKVGWFSKNATKIKGTETIELSAFGVTDNISVVDRKNLVVGKEYLLTYTIKDDPQTYSVKAKLKGIK